MKEVKITKFSYLTNGLPIIVLLPQENKEDLQTLLEIYIKDQLEKFVVEIKNQKPPILQKLEKKKKELEELKENILRLIKKVGIRADKEYLPNEELTIFFEDTKKGSIEYTTLKSKEELKNLVGKYKEIYFIKNKDMLDLAKQSIDNFKKDLQNFKTTSQKIESLVEVLALKRIFETLSNLVPVRFSKHGIIIDLTNPDKAIMLETFLYEKISKKISKDYKFNF